MGLFGFPCKELKRTLGMPTGQDDGFEGIRTCEKGGWRFLRYNLDGTTGPKAMIGWPNRSMD